MSERTSTTEASGVERTASEAGVLNFDWYRALRGNARHGFWAGFWGWALDAFDFTMLPLALSAIAATFTLTQPEAGLIVTVTLVASGFGGMFAGLLADKIGRVRTLMFTIAVFSVMTFLSGLAQSYEQLLVFKALQGLGFGGEYAAGAILVSELSNPAQRGRVMGFIQSAWAIGWGLAIVSFTVVFSLAGPETAWRILFMLGVLPGLLVLYVRRNVAEPEVYVATREEKKAETQAAVERGATASPLVQIFRRDLIGTTAAGTLLGVGAQGGYWAVFTWLPAYLASERGLTVVGTGSYLAVMVVGFFFGYASGGYIHDWLGRRPTCALFALGSIALILLYTRIPVGANSLLLVLGLPLGFFAAGNFSGLGNYLGELFPSRARGMGVGFTYNFGRALAAFFPVVVGLLSASFGLTGALGFGALTYGLVIVAVLLLPETKGKRMVALD
jgi:MFS family permease